MLKVEGVHVEFGPIRALRGVSLRVEEGEIVTVLGSNGAGKSTLLASIAGLVQPTQGKIVFTGHDLGGLPAHRRSRMGLALVPEGRRLFNNMSVRDNLSLAASCHGISKAELRTRADQAEAMFPALANLRHRLAGTLSGGEQQMLAVSRALVLAPKLIMLDEPSLGLAPKLVIEIFRAIDQLRAAGVAILLVEQMAHLSLEFADRAYVLERGAVSREGTSAELRMDDSVQRSYLGPN